MIIVYLDQNHLSNLAKHLHGAKVDRRVAPLAEVLATSIDVVCPFSFAHVAETVACTDRRLREIIAATVARIARGRCYRNDGSLRRIEMAALRRGRRSTPLAVTVDPLAIFPNGAIDPFARDVLDLDGTSGFGELVEAMANDSDMRTQIEASKQHTKQHAERIQEARAREATTPPAARRAERGAVVQLLSEESGLPAAEVENLLAADQPDAVGRLWFSADYAVNHSMKLTRPPADGDALDAAHAMYAAYSEVFLTERYVAEITRIPLRRLGCFCTRDPSAAADFLRERLHVESGARAAAT